VNISRPRQEDPSQSYVTSSCRTGSGCVNCDTHICVTYVCQLQDVNSVGCHDRWNVSVSFPKSASIFFLSDAGYVFSYHCKDTWLFVISKFVTILWDWGCLRTGCWGEYLEPKRDEVTEDWRKLHNEERHNLYSSQSIIRMMIKSSRMRSVGHVARMRLRGMHTGILVAKSERYH
jgi:hypothetical protein